MGIRMLVKRILQTLVSKLLRTTFDENNPRADMHLPDGLLVFSIILLLVSIGFVIAFIFALDIWMIVVAVCSILLGALAFVCWKNQTIQIISNEKFEYTTFLGNKYTYYFKDITGIRQNSDSMTLFVGNKKIHIESIAILSDRLVDLINNELNNKA